MPNYHCTCDPHGDNAKCDRECCKPKRAHVPKPSREDMADATETLRMLASRVRGTGVAQSLTRVAAWIEDQAAQPGEHTGLEYRGG